MADIRIGAGVPGAPASAPMPTAGRKPKRTRDWIVGLSLVFALLAGLALLVRFGLGNDNPAATASPTGPTPLTENAVCQVLVPAMTVGTDVVTDYLRYLDGGQGLGVRRAELASSVSAIDAVRQGAPAAMRADIDAQLAGMRAVLSFYDSPTKKVGVDVDAYRASGLRLSATCSQYANN